MIHGSVSASSILLNRPQDTFYKIDYSSIIRKSIQVFTWFQVLLPAAWDDSVETTVTGTEVLEDAEVRG